MVTYVTNLVELIGLGLAIDYSLLVVHRFREELARRRAASTDAIVRTMATAGRAVVVSGLAVAVGLGLLLFMPVPLLRSMGVGGLLIPLASIAAALTLQPALLSLVGAPRRRRRASTSTRGFWARLARAIMRRPRRVPRASAPRSCSRLAAPARRPRPDARLVLRAPVGARGDARLRAAPRRRRRAARHADPGRRRRGRARAARVAPARGRRSTASSTRRLHDPEVLHRRERAAAAATSTPTGRYARVVVARRHEYGDDAEPAASCGRLRDDLVPRARFPAGARVYAGGAPAQGVDFLDRVLRRVPVARARRARAHVRSCCCARSARSSCR